MCEGIWQKLCSDISESINSTNENEKHTYQTSNWEESGHIVFIPILAAAFDLLENLGVANLLINFPEISRSAVAVASLFTITKSIFTSIFFIVIFYLLFEFVRKKSRVRTK